MLMPNPKLVYLFCYHRLASVKILQGEEIAKGDPFYAVAVAPTDALSANRNRVATNPHSTCNIYIVLRGTYLTQGNLLV